MRNVLLIAALTAFLVGFTGCGKELNDENFADFWVEYSAAADDTAQEKVMDSYGWKEDDLDAYVKELTADEERVQKLYDALKAKDENAALAFTFLIVPGEVLDGAIPGDLGAIPYVEGGTTAMTDALLAELFVKIYPEEPNSPAALAVYPEYGVTGEQVEGYFDTVADDPAHAAAVSVLVHGLDPEKGAEFDRITGLTEPE
ncbi:MAG TPA: hypothetical protein VM054_08955 [bacterium]|nr:hypothetical protein [bacterium]